VTATSTATGTSLTVVIGWTGKSTGDARTLTLQTDVQ
jgi:hypothetical protein